MINNMVNYCKASYATNRDAYNNAMLFGLMAALVAMPDVSHATAVAAFEGVVCEIVAVLQGGVARAVAAVGIIILGFSLFLGKISWGVALALGIGIAAVFGAKDIVDVLADAGGGAGNACP